MRSHKLSEIAIHTNIVSVIRLMTNSTTTRQNLAYAYQILAMLGLDDHTYTHLSCRASKPNTFYIQPFGLKFSEITPECLLEVSHEGKILSGKELIYTIQQPTKPTVPSTKRAQIYRLFFISTQRIWLPYQTSKTAYYP